MKVTKTILAVIMILFAVSALAQTATVQAKPLTDKDIELLRQDVQAIKQDVIKDTMAFTEAEAAAFWPVYQEYAKEQHAIAERRLSLITEYAQNLDKMEDAKAADLTKRMFAIDDDTQSLRKAYYPKFEKALGARRAAKFYQVDNRLIMIVNVQLASEVPLIP